MGTFQEKKKKWITENPLRKWRLEQDLTQTDIASVVGVSFHTIYNWETGMSSPDSEQILKLSSLTKIKSLAKDWVVWYQQRPRLGQEAKSGRQGVDRKVDRG